MSDLFKQESASKENLNKAFLEAMKKISKYAADQSKAAITIKATIVGIKDDSKRLYTVSYRNNTFDVTSNSDLNYQQGDNVYVLVPDGDFSKEKMIIGAVSTKPSMYISVIGNDNKYITISDNLIAGSSSVDLRSWYPEEKAVPADFTNFNTLFSKYIEEYNNFVFSAKIKTEIDKDHQVEGQYGLILHLPIFRDPGDGTSSWIEDTYDCRMDTTTIQGNVYDFTSAQLSNLYFSLPDNVIYDTSREPTISAFVNGFNYTEDPIGIDSDINFSDIQIKIVDKLSDSDISGYHLALVSSNGNYFLPEDITGKKLTPVLKLDGKKIDIKDWSCYWFEEDASIKTDNRDYHYLGGLGWKCLNEKINIQINEEGKETFEFNTSQKTWTVAEDAVPALKRYKCVLVQDDISVNAVIKLENLKNDIKINLFSFTGSNNFIKDIGEVMLTAQIIYPLKPDTIQLEYEWLRFDKNNNYIDNNFFELEQLNEEVDTDKWETKIKYSCSLVDKNNTIICNFYGRNANNERINLGTCSLMISTISESTYILTTLNGDVLYKYDSDGDSPLVANYDGPLSSKIETIKPIEFKVFKPNGTELNEKEYLACYYSWAFPKNSMLELVGYDTQEEKDALRQDDDYYYLEGYGQNSLNYNISSLFSRLKNNNSIILTVTFDHTNLSAVISPKFLKEGESGTNGNKFSAIIQYKATDGSYGYGERDEQKRIRKLQFVYFVSNRQWYKYDVTHAETTAIGNSELTVAIYNNGQPVTDYTNYQFKWEMFDAFGGSVDNEKVNFTCCELLAGENAYTQIIRPNVDWIDPIIYTNVVRVKVEIPDTETNKKEVIYAYYPIEITWINSNITYNEKMIIPTMTGGFDQVVYGSDGTGAEYDSANPFQCNDYLYENNSNKYWYNWESGSNIRVNSYSHEYTNRATPVTKFDSGISKNYIATRLTLNQEQRDLIDNEKNALEVDNRIYSESKDYYSDSKTTMNSFSDAFNKNALKTKVESASGLLAARAKLLDEALSLYYINEDIYEAFVDARIIDYDYESYYDRVKSSVNTALERARKLISTGSLSSVSDLNNIEIDSDIVAEYKQKVRQLDKYAQEQQMHLKQYNIYYTKLKAKTAGEYNYQEELDNVHDAYDYIYDTLVNNNDLRTLTNREGADQQDYINLKNSITIIYNTMKNGELNTLNDILTKVVNQLGTLLENYQNKDYQNKHFDEKVSDYENKINENEKLIESKNAALLPVATDLMLHIKPIVMLFNRFEMSNLNGWDGNKLYTDEKNNQYILAPQFGAGTKEDDGSFTGVTMGIRKFNNRSSVETGLFGYSSGEQSFFLNAEDGSAIFGRNGTGQILIDPSDENKGRIYSGNYYDEDSYGEDGKVRPSAQPSGKGMMINLTDGKIHLGTSVGQIHSGTHSILDSRYDGFYLGHDGLSIGAGVKIESNGHFIFGNKSTEDNQYIEYDGEKITLGGGIEITWARVTNKDNVITTNGNDGTTSIDDADLSNNDDFKGFKTEVDGSLNTTKIGSNYVISPKIAGGYLYLTGSQGSIEINPNGETGITGSAGKILSVKNSSGTEVIGFDSDGNAIFSGIIKGSKFTTTSYEPSGDPSINTQTGTDIVDDTIVLKQGVYGSILGNVTRISSDKIEFYNGGTNVYQTEISQGNLIIARRKGDVGEKVEITTNGITVGSSSNISVGNYSTIENAKISSYSIYGSNDVTSAKDMYINNFDKVASQKWVNEKGYITSSALSGYATETWVENKKYLTSSSLSGYATETWVSSHYVDDTEMGVHINNLNNAISKKANSGRYGIGGSITAPKDGGSCDFNLYVII